MPLKDMDFSGFSPQLDPRLTQQQIESMRYKATWQKAMVCPKRIKDKRNHDLNCDVCDGTGFLYFGNEEVKVLVTSISLRQMYESFGRFDAGMAMISSEVETRLSWWDKLTLTESVIRFTEPVQRGTAGVTDKLKYKIVDTIGVAPKVQNKAGVIALRGSAGQSYVRGTDYNVVNGDLVWVNPPAAGEFYSIAYYARPVYILLDVTHQMRNLPTSFRKVNETFAFPTQAVGKLDFLIGDESKATE